MNKKTIAVLFGGQSSEHEVSCVSVRTILQAIDREEYNVEIIGITKEGHWLAGDCRRHMEKRYGDSRDLSGCNQKRDYLQWSGWI